MPVNCLVDITPWQALANCFRRRVCGPKSIRQNTHQNIKYLQVRGEMRLIYFSHTLPR